ncbi:hypothetical protein M378DRAFT_17291 [Amanita muscaria Koide BX008]|uniref:Uncharacterized protein n=1 Tax=Amanita muscaria (strain Koide BX008) TaxID=946122 RepID=A0A0C2WJ73_AMAMK|nr:hypothetical protein M378DRAFT_17291 [Amanita muscaria Koide BX008]
MTAICLRSCEWTGYQGYDERRAGAIVPIGGEEADDDADWGGGEEKEEVTQVFQNLDRQTDTTVVLVVSPADSSKLHRISSRSIRRTPVLGRSPAMHQLKASFRGVAQHRRQTRTRKIPIIDHILTASSAGGDGSDGSSSESREGDLRRALDAALNDAEEHVRIQNGEVERRDDEDASREGKRRVYAQTALWRKTSDDDDDEWGEWAVVDLVAIHDADRKKEYTCPDFLRRLSL